MNQSASAQPPGTPEIEYPALYVAASEAAKRGKFWHKLLTFLEIGLVILALSVTLIAALVIPQPVAHGDLRIDHTDFRQNLAAIAAAGSFLVAMLIKLVGKTTGFDGDWYIGRAVAEATRSEAWRYMVKDTPYTDSQADRRFADTIRALLRRTRDIRHAVDRLPSRPLQITPSMRAVRNMALAGRRDAYLTQRLEEQSRWYASRSSHHRVRASIWFWLAFVFQLAAAISAIWALHLVEFNDQSQVLLKVMSLFGSLAIAFTAWTQLNRDDELARAYAYSVQELSLVAGDAERAQSDRALAGAVSAGEAVIARENKAWLAKRGELVESPEFGHSD